LNPLPYASRAATAQPLHSYFVSQAPMFTWCAPAGIDCGLHAGVAARALTQPQRRGRRCRAEAKPCNRILCQLPRQCFPGTAELTHATLECTCRLMRGAIRAKHLLPHFPVPAHTAGGWCTPQVKPPGVQEWGLARRAGAVVRNGTKLLGVGFFASLFGVTITNVLVKVPAPAPLRRVMCTARCHRCCARVKVQTLQVSSSVTHSVPSGPHDDGPELQCAKPATKRAGHVRVLCQLHG
jgi:hypothetical protein